MDEINEREETPKETRGGTGVSDHGGRIGHRPGKGHKRL